jgi:thymidylate kinase
MSINTLDKTKPLCIVVEGLDGIGKTTTIKHLAEKLSAKIIVTPPDIIKPFRSIYADANFIERKTYYMVGNYIAGEEVKRILFDSKQPQSVIIDRFYASTIAYLIGKMEIELPPINDKLFEWPEKLYKPDYMFVLTMSESDRIDRLCSRSIEHKEQLTKEDIMIRSNPLISERINQIYRNIGCIEIKVNKEDTTEMIINKIISNIES